MDVLEAIAQAVQPSRMAWPVRTALQDLHQQTRTWTYPMSSDSTIEAKLEMLHDDFNDMKSVLKELAVAVNRFAIVEERQMQSSGLISRLADSIQSIEMRVTEIETAVKLAAIKNSSTTQWVDRSIAAIVGAAMIYVAKKIGFI